MSKNYPQKIEPVSVRQLAVALLILIICSVLLLISIYKHKQKKITYSKVIVPTVIKHKITSSPDDMESTHFVIPLVK